jgi:hypothetical protein
MQFRIQTTGKGHSVALQTIPAIALDIESVLLDIDGPFYDCVGSGDIPLNPADFPCERAPVDMFEQATSQAFDAAATQEIPVMTMRQLVDGEVQ